jgi:hypothetical protein
MTHPAAYPLGAGWGMKLTIHLPSSAKAKDAGVIYLQSPVHLHGIVLN